MNFKKNEYVVIMLLCLVGCGVSNDKNQQMFRNTGNTNIQRQPFNQMEQQNPNVNQYQSQHIIQQQPTTLNQDMGSNIMGINRYSPYTQPQQNLITSAIESSSLPIEEVALSILATSPSKKSNNNPVHIRILAFSKFPFKASTVPIHPHIRLRIVIKFGICFFILNIS